MEVLQSKWCLNELLPATWTAFFLSKIPLSQFAVKPWIAAPNHNLNSMIHEKSEETTVAWTQFPIHSFAESKLTMNEEIRSKIQFLTKLMWSSALGVEEQMSWNFSQLFPGSLLQEEPMINADITDNTNQAIELGWGRLWWIKSPQLSLNCCQAAERGPSHCARRSHPFHPSSQAALKYTPRQIDPF